MKKLIVIAWVLTLAVSIAGTSAFACGMGKEHAEGGTAQEGTA